MSLITAFAPIALSGNLAMIINTIGIKNSLYQHKYT